MLPQLFRTGHFHLRAVYLGIAVLNPYLYIEDGFFEANPIMALVISRFGPVSGLSIKVLSVFLVLLIVLLGAKRLTKNGSYYN